MNQTRLLYLSNFRFIVDLLLFTVMKEFPIRSIFLPATIVGVSIFSVMAFTLPTFINRYGVNVKHSDEVRSSSILTGVHKELAITYIGSAIVVSTGAGLGVAELLRKRSASPAKSPNLKSRLAELVDQDAQQLSSNSELAMTFAEMLTEQSAVETDWLGTADNLDQSSYADCQELASELSETPNLSVWQDLQYSGERVSSQPENSPDIDDGTVMIFPGQYQCCRVQVPDLSEQQDAINFNQRFYRLLGSSVSKGQALAAVKQLCQEQQTAILTHTNRGYAVWVLAPQAILCSHLS